MDDDEILSWQSSPETDRPMSVSYQVHYRDIVATESRRIRSSLEHAAQLLYAKAWHVNLDIQLGRDVCESLSHCVVVVSAVSRRRGSEAVGPGRPTTVACTQQNHRQRNTRRDRRNPITAAPGKSLEPTADADRITALPQPQQTGNPHHLR